MMKVAFFDTKPYDMPGFDHYAADAGLEIKYFETRLNEDTVSLAAGYDAVCVFVNDTVNANVAEKLYQLGVKVIALRCAATRKLWNTFWNIKATLKAMTIRP